VTDDRDLRSDLEKLAWRSLHEMSTLASEGKEVAAVSFGVDSVRLLSSRLLSERVKNGYRFDAEAVKAEMKRSLSPEHYLVWEEKVLPVCVAAWEDAARRSHEPGDVL